MLNAEFLEDEVQLLVQGLDLLLASKREAFRQVARRDSDGGRLAVFAERDFGIPQIIDLQAKIDGATVWAEPESGASS